MTKYIFILSAMICTVACSNVKTYGDKEYYLDDTYCETVKMEGNEPVCYSKKYGKKHLSPLTTAQAQQIKSKEFSLGNITMGILSGLAAAEPTTAKTYNDTSTFTNQMIAQSGQTISNMQNRQAVQGTWAQPKQTTRVQPINSYGAIVSRGGSTDYVPFANQKCQQNSNIINCDGQTFRIVNDNTIQGDGVQCMRIGGSWSCYKTM